MGNDGLLLSWNAFCYCGNDPENCSDPTGFYTASSLRGKSFLFKLASKYGINLDVISRDVKPKIIYMLNLWAIIFTISISVRLTKNYKAGISFNFAKTNIGVSYNTGLGKGYSIAFAYTLSWTYLKRSMSLVYSAANDGVYASLNVEFQINHLATAAALAACYVVPALVPVVKVMLTKSRTVSTAAMSMIAMYVQVRYL